MITKNKDFDNKKYTKKLNKKILINICHISKSTEYKKTEIIKDDGRYLIYYDFKNNEN